MSSRRFPGKVLAPFRGRPLIEAVLEAADAGVGPETAVVVVTSTDRTDDPLAAHLHERGRSVFRGPLEDVVGRFRLALDQYPCEWALRVNADSPLLCPGVIRAIVAARRADLDLVTTTFPRSFPKGQNAELLRVSTFLGVDVQEFDADDREHVTRIFYRQPSRFRIHNVSSPDARLSGEDLSVDTVESLLRLEQLDAADVARLLAYTA